MLLQTCFQRVTASTTSRSQHQLYLPVLPPTLGQQQSTENYTHNYSHRLATNGEYQPFAESPRRCSLAAEARYWMVAAERQDLAHKLEAMLYVAERHQH